MTPARAVLIAVALTSGGCRVLVELVDREPGDDEPAVDAVDGEMCAGWSLTPAGLDPCDFPAPIGPLVLGPGTWVFDTNSGVLTDPAQNTSVPSSALVTSLDGVELRVVPVEALTVETGAVLRVHGTRPLLALAWSFAQIDGEIDLGSQPGAEAAGADPAACAAMPAQRGADDPEGAGGGGGGGLGAAGAAGGAGNATMAPGGPAGAAAPSPVALRGGCAGGPGGNLLGGSGGAGGGALQLAARERLNISGAIGAGGGGGGAAQGGRGGGGGGGSGGVVIVSAPSVRFTSTAVIAANGGGGGGGSDLLPASRGQDGGLGAGAAAAGSGQGMGGDGGDGGAASTAARQGPSARRGGGGGGGAVGVIVLESPALVVDAEAVLSPPPTAR